MSVEPMSVCAALLIAAAGPPDLPAPGVPVLDPLPAPAGVATLDATAGGPTGDERTGVACSHGPLERSGAGPGEHVERSAVAPHAHPAAFRSAALRGESMPPGEDVPTVVHPAPPCRCPNCRAARAEVRAVEDAADDGIGPPYHYQRVFEPPPLGALMHATMAAQVRNGEASLLVLHRMDFHAGSALLNPAGLRRLGDIAARLPRTARPVIVEPPRPLSTDAAGLAAAAALGQARRAEAARLLAGGAFPVPDQRVVLLADPASGLDGPDAELAYRNLLILTGSGGKLRTRFDVFGRAAQSPTAAAPAGAANPAGPAQ